MNIAKTLELEKTKTINGEFNGVAYQIEVKTNVVTTRFMQQMADAKDRPIEIANGLADALTSWDIDWNGKEFPPTAENIARLPVEFATELLDRLLQSVTEETKAKSEGKLASASKANG